MFRYFTRAPQFCLHKTKQTASGATVFVLRNRSAHCADNSRGTLPTYTLHKRRRHRVRLTKYEQENEVRSYSGCNADIQGSDRTAVSYLITCKAAGCRPFSAGPTDLVKASARASEGVRTGTDTKATVQRLRVVHGRVKPDQATC
jgi:hypothetical protein